MTKQRAARQLSSPNQIICLIRFIIFISLLFVTGIIHANEVPVENQSSDQIITISDTVPPGFEDLAGPQTNQVDVFYQNKYLVSTIATYDFETLRFHQPQEVINKIEDLINRDQILKIISQPLQTNNDLICLTHTLSDNCGTLQPNIAGIIFDEGRFRVDLFINPLQLETKAIHSTKFLSPAEEKFSTIHVLSLNASGTDTAEDRYNGQADSMLAFGSGRLKVKSNYTDNEDFIIDEASIQKDHPGWEMEGGVFDTETRSSNFLPE